jgi:hypothetical protein
MHVMKFKCDLCHRIFRYKQTLMEHIETIHLNIPVVKPTCDICHKVMKNRLALNDHKISAHDEINKISCVLCPAKFKAKCQIYTHLQNVHSKEVINHM